MKTSFKLVSLAALTAATLALPAAAQGTRDPAKCMPKAEAAKCGAKCAGKTGMKKHRKMSSCSAKKCGAKCSAKCGAKCASKS